MKYVVAVFLLCNCSFSFSQSKSSLLGSQVGGRLNTITTAVPFLMITPDAKSGGMGDAGCASTPDAWSNYWNTSKNVFLEKNNGISFSYTPWLRALVPGIRLFDMSLYKKLGKKNVIGFSGRYFSLGYITFTNIAGGTIGHIRPHEYAYSFSYTRLLTSKFSVGISARRIYSDLMGGRTIIAGVNYFPAKSIAGDLSCYWKDTFMLKEKISEFAWGINISNVGQKMKYNNDTAKPGDFLPTNLRIGVSYKININKNNSLEFICDANKLLVPTPPIYASDSFGNPMKDLNGQYVIQAGKDPNRSVFNALYSSFYDAPGGYKEELSEINIASGFEYWCYKTVAVRAGYFNEANTKGGKKYITLGIGGRYASFSLDISYLIPTHVRNPLQNTCRFTLACEFGLHGKETKKN